jgi:hypothetical protein
MKKIVLIKYILIYMRIPNKFDIFIVFIINISKN